MHLAPKIQSPRRLQPNPHSETSINNPSETFQHTHARAEQQQHQPRPPTGEQPPAPPALSCRCRRAMPGTPSTPDTRWRSCPGAGRPPAEPHRSARRLRVAARSLTPPAPDPDPASAAPPLFSSSEHGSAGHQGHQQGRTAVSAGRAASVCAHPAASTMRRFCCASPILQYLTAALPFPPLRCSHVSTFVHHNERAKDERLERQVSLQPRKLGPSSIRPLATSCSRSLQSSAHCAACVRLTLSLTTPHAPRAGRHRARSRGPQEGRRRPRQLGRPAGGRRHVRAVGAGLA